MRYLVSLILNVMVYSLAYFVAEPEIQNLLRGNEWASVLISACLYWVSSVVITLVVMGLSVALGSILGGIAGGRKGVGLGACLAILIIIPLALLIDQTVIVSMPQYIDFAPQFSNGVAWLIVVVTLIIGIGANLGNDKSKK